MAVGGARYLPPSILISYHLFNLRRSQDQGSMPLAKASVPHNQKRQLRESASVGILVLLAPDLFERRIKWQRFLDDEASETSSQRTLPELAEYFEFLVFTPRE